MKWILPGLMILIILPGLHYTGFINWFGSSFLEEAPDLNAFKKTDTQTLIYSPELQVQSLSKEGNEKAFSLQKLKGQVVLLNFWASWCVPCREEFPELIEAVKWGKGDLSLVAVSVDSSSGDIKKFFKQLNVGQRQSLKNPNIYIVWDPEFKTASQFNVVKFPETFILNQNLQIVKKLAGLFLLEKERSELIKFLPAAKPK